MKLSEIIQLDCNKKENKIELMKALKKLPMFADVEGKVHMESIEALITRMSNKYPVRLSYIMIGPMDEQYYTFMLKRSDTHEWLKTIYGKTLYEGMCKVCLFMYGYIKNVVQKEQNDGK